MDTHIPINAWPPDLKVKTTIIYTIMIINPYTAMGA